MPKGIKGFQIKTLAQLKWESFRNQWEIARLKKEYSNGLIHPRKLAKRLKHYENKLKNFKGGEFQNNKAKSETKQ